MCAISLLLLSALRDPAPGHRPGPKARPGLGQARGRQEEGREAGEHGPGGAPRAPGLFRLWQISRRHGMTALSRYVRSCCKGKGTNCLRVLWEGHVITGLPFSKERLGLSSGSGIQEASAFPSSEGFQKYAGLTLIRVNSEVNPASGQAQRSFYDT